MVEYHLKHLIILLFYHDDELELNNNQLCLIALGGHKKLKEFINKEYPKLQYMSSNIMYKTIAMDYYRNKV